jgi:hypothetical protein
MMRRWLLLTAVCLICSCGRSKPASSPVDAAVNPQPDMGTGTGGTGGSSSDGGVGQVPCLDQPTDLPRPPSGMLPCELIPPEFK